MKKKKIINYQIKWKSQKVKVDDLILDIKNIRLEVEFNTQEEIINDLFLNEEAMAVLESIHQNGFFPDEPPVIIKENNKFIVLDGNRRVVSLKAMLNPTIAPIKDRNKIVKIMSDSIPIEEISVHVASSRDEAMEYLAAKHTKNTRKQWSTLRRAYFYYAQKEQGKTVEQLIERYKGVNIPEYIKMYEMHKVALSMKNTTKDIRKKTENKRSFPISTLDRLYSDSYVQNKLGIEIDKKTGEVKVPTSNDFDKVYSRTITDIVTKVATSRKELSEEKDRKKYIDSIVKEELGKDKIFASNKKPATEFKPVLKPIIKKDTRLIPANFECPFDSGGIKRVLWELKQIDHRIYPNAYADLLRTFLEVTLKKYLIEIGELPKPKKLGGYLFIGNLLEKIKADCKTASNHTIEQVIKEIIKNKWYLDSINHNPEVFAVGDRVEEAWDQVYPLIKYLFDDYKKRHK